MMWCSVCSGAAGSPDSGTVYPPNAPFEHKGEIWLYYHGNNMLHGEATRRGEEPQGGLYLHPHMLPPSSRLCAAPNTPEIR